MRVPTGKGTSIVVGPLGPIVANVDPSAGCTGPRAVGPVVVASLAAEVPPAVGTTFQCPWLKVT